MKNLTSFGRYKNDIFNKLGFEFQPGLSLLDVGCGDGTDAEIFIKEFGLDVTGIDVYTDTNIKNINGIKFTEGSIFKIPARDKTFDYVFLHDVLHHVDEKNQAFENHVKALKELKRVVKPNGYIIIIEANRYNPLFYPHMVKMLKHNHWKQSYFKKVVGAVFEDAKFKHFEAHNYPWGKSIWKVYEFIMEKLSPKGFLAYNVAILRKPVQN